MDNSNTKIKVCLLGTSGMLGYALNQYYKRKGYVVTAIDRSQFDAGHDSVDKLSGLLQNVSFVVNAIGIIKPRISGSNQEQAFIVNGLFPRNLAKLTSSLSIPCFHITTDCVFSGAQGHYTEDDYFDIDDTYGLSKLAGENVDCMCLRTSIIGEELNNKYSLFEWAKSHSGQEVNGYTNHRWNGLTTTYLAETIEHIYINNLYQKGIFHLYSPEVVSKYELLGLINDIYKLNLTIKPSSPSPAIDRSLSSKYDLSKESVVKNLRQQISEMHQFFQT